MDVPRSLEDDIMGSRRENVDFDAALVVVPDIARRRPRLIILRLVTSAHNRSHSLVGVAPVQAQALASCPPRNNGLRIVRVSGSTPRDATRICCAPERCRFNVTAFHAANTDVVLLNIVKSASLFS
ncbi:hypothetical protein MRX96_059263 [Rhipicephalus microplus]